MVSDIYTLHIPGRLVSTNSTRRRHWRVEHKLTQEWRHAAKVVAMEAKVPALDRIAVAITPQQARGKLADIGAYTVMAKAAVDGLVDAGVIPVDDPEHVVYMAQLPGERVLAAGEGLRVEIVPADGTTGWRRRWIV